MGRAPFSTPTLATVGGGHRTRPRLGEGDLLVVVLHEDLVRVLATRDPAPRRTCCACAASIAPELPVRSRGTRQGLAEIRDILDFTRAQRGSRTSDAGCGIAHRPFGPWPLRGGKAAMRSAIARAAGVRRRGRRRGRGRFPSRTQRRRDGAGQRYRACICRVLRPQQAAAVARDQTVFTWVASVRCGGHHASQTSRPSSQPDVRTWTAATMGRHSISDARVRPTSVLQETWSCRGLEHESNRRRPRHLAGGSHPRGAHVTRCGAPERSRTCRAGVERLSSGTGERDLRDMAVDLAESVFNRSLRAIGMTRPRPAPTPTTSPASGTAASDAALLEGDAHSMRAKWIPNTGSPLPNAR